MARRRVDPEETLRRKLIRQTEFLAKLTRLDRDSPVPSVILLTEATKVLTTVSDLVMRRSSEVTEKLKALRKSIGEPGSN